jgi:cytochrome c
MNIFTRHPEKMCPAFKKQDAIIKDIIKKINKIEGLSEKVSFAEKLQKEANILLNCPDFAGNKTECKNCHFIAQLRKKTADLILEVKTFGKMGRPDNG